MGKVSLDANLMVSFKKLVLRTIEMQESSTTGRVGRGKQAEEKQDLLEASES